MAQDSVNKYMMIKKKKKPFNKCLLSVWEPDIVLGLGMPRAALAFKKGDNHAVRSPTVRSVLEVEWVPLQPSVGVLQGGLP